MPKKPTKLPSWADCSLKLSECPKVKPNWTKEAESYADQLAAASWHPYGSRPSGDKTGFFVVCHWYQKEKTWVPLFLGYDLLSSRLGRIFNGKETSPICKYLSSFPRKERRTLMVKWLVDEQRHSSPMTLNEMLTVFSGRYNQGEMLPFNADDSTSTVPDNFSLLDY